MHATLSRPTHDEQLRQQFVFALKMHTGAKVRPGNRVIYEKAVKPRFQREHGHEPESVKEIAEVMWQHPGYQMFSALNRKAQELMWDSLIDHIYRDAKRMSDSYLKLKRNAGTKGSVTLDPDLEIPRGIATVDIHLQPGGFSANYGEDDVLAGAIQEAGTNLYCQSSGISTSENKAEVVMRFLQERYPTFTPTKILDCGCSSGSSSTPWALAFPEAEVHAIDVGAAMLRYAHTRAEVLAAKVHFHQMDAAQTSFPDEQFDLVVSHNAMHEMSRKTTEGMFRESFRLLKPGGLVIHQDVWLRFEEFDTFEQFDNSWDMENNNEPYWTVYATNNPCQMFLDAGFNNDSIWVGKFSQLDNTADWFISAARKNES